MTEDPLFKPKSQTHFTEFIVKISEKKIKSEPLFLQGFKCEYFNVI